MNTHRQNRKKKRAVKNDSFGQMTKSCTVPISIPSLALMLAFGSSHLVPKNHHTCFQACFSMFPSIWEKSRLRPGRATSHPSASVRRQPASDQAAWSKEQIHDGWTLNQWGPNSRDVGHVLGCWVVHAIWVVYTFSPFAWIAKCSV